MKKILFSIIALIGLLTSCSNDDIIIDRNITFKINPATVVDNLYEYNAGDLTALDVDAKLNVSLFIYNEDGILVEKVSNQYSAYTHIMNADLSLSEGNYTAVAMSHVTSKVEFWSFSGLDRLSTFKITDTGKIGGKNKILGLTIKKIHVDKISETIDVNIENAGAVALVRFYKWNKYSNVKIYSLMGKQACDYVSFDNNGNQNYSLRSSDTYDYYKVKMQYDADYSGGYGYFFTFPIKNASFHFYAETDNGAIGLGPNLVDDVNIGETYCFFYNFDEDEAHWYNMTPNNAKSTTIRGIVEKMYQENDRIKYNYDSNCISIQ